MRYKYPKKMKYEYTNKKPNGSKIIYPQMSYKIIGCLFEVYNQCGGGHRESFYQKAFCKELSLNGILYKEQVAVNIEYKGENIGKNYIDVLIDDKIVVELKVGEYFSRGNLKQVMDYLKITKCKLGLIVNFSDEKLKYYRVLNIK